MVQAYTLDILLATGGVGLTRLAQALRLDKSTTSRVVSGMTRRGLVEWSRAKHDRRAKEIVASGEGKRRYERLRHAIMGDNARLLASYSPSERQAAITILRQLADRAAGAALSPSRAIQMPTIPQELRYAVRSLRRSPSSPASSWRPWPSASARWPRSTRWPTWS